MNLTPGAATLTELETLWRGGGVARLAPDARPAVEAAHARVARAAAGGEAVYGVNTGFGKLASVRIAPEDTATLQRNLILSHCCGVGAPLEPAARSGSSSCSSSSRSGAVPPAWPGRPSRSSRGCWRRTSFR